MKKHNNIRLENHRSTSSKLRNYFEAMFAADSATLYFRSSWSRKIRKIDLSLKSTKESAVWKGIMCLARKEVKKGKKKNTHVNSQFKKQIFLFSVVTKNHNYTTKWKKKNIFFSIEIASFPITNQDWKWINLRKHKQYTAAKTACLWLCSERKIV